MIIPAAFTYVLCFLTRAGKAGTRTSLTGTCTSLAGTRGDRVLMLHRLNPPNQGLWNGVGGRLEADEAPRAACLREVREETGFVVPEVRFAGLLTWSGFPGHADGGLYIFTAPAPVGEPGTCAEGELRWQPRAWVYTAADVVENIHYFAPCVLDGAPPCVYHFEYGAQGQILHHEVYALPFWVVGI